MRISRLVRLALGLTGLLALSPLAAPSGAFSLAARTAQPAPALSSPTFTFDSDHYEVTSNLDRREAVQVAHHMDLVFQEYERRLSSFGTRNAKRIRLFLFDTRDDYLAYLASQGVDGTNSGGMFFVLGGDASLATFSQGQPRRRMLGVLQHEGFHQFAFVRISDNLPVWVNEGLAEYFEQAVLVRTQFRIGQAGRSKIARLQAAIEDANVFTFEQLLGMTSHEWSTRVTSGDPRAITMYDQAWSMVHFLVHARNGRYAGMFEKYLRSLAQGMNREQAFRNAFETDDIQSFESAWKQYVAELQPDPISTVVENLEMLTPMIAELHRRGVNPTNIDELRAALGESGIAIRRYDAGIVRVVKADDPELFDIPTPARRTRPPSIEPIPPRSDEPLGIEVRGLEATIRLVWRKIDGEWTGDIEFQ